MTDTGAAVTAAQFLAICANAIRKIVRQPLVLLLSCSCVCLIGLLPMVVMFNFGEEGKLVRDGALALHLVFGLAVTVASASAALRSEIRGGNASIVLAKPVSRTVFLLAIFSGILVMVAAFSLQAMASGLLSLKISSHLEICWRTAALMYGAVAGAFALAAAVNAWLKRSFVAWSFLLMLPALLAALAAAACLYPCGQSEHVAASCAMHAEHLGSAGQAIQWRMAPAGVLITMALAVFAAISMAFSTRLPPVFTGTFCVAILFLGLVADYYLEEARNVSPVAAACYALLPNWQDFWMADALSGEGCVPWSYVAKAGAYACLYLSGVLCIALASFRSVELK